ncbi:MAG: SDR family oxidoreductase [Ignavibacteria bacterium]|nr:SDR family oxidoreductase [Ignavibacteria bacterium]
MKLGLNGKTAFIAASSDGIGRAIARSLASEGARLVLCARREEPLSALQEELRAAHGAEVEYVTGNLDAAGDVTRMTDAALEMYGTIDILVANNGGPQPGTFEALDETAWAAAWERTLLSPVRLIRALLPGMKARGWGRIVTVTSISVKQPIARLMLSNTYRAAVTGMAKTLSDEVAGLGITVNCIAPGYIGTDRLTHLFADRAAQSGRTPDEERALMLAGIPAGRLGLPEEVGDLACFLASERAAYITGETILVDGGLYRGSL